MHVWVCVVPVLCKQIKFVLSSWHHCINTKQNCNSYLIYSSSYNKIKHFSRKCAHVELKCDIICPSVCFLCLSLSCSLPFFTHSPPALFKPLESLLCTEDPVWSSALLDPVPVYLNDPFCPVPARLINCSSLFLFARGSCKFCCLTTHQPLCIVAE